MLMSPLSDRVRFPGAVDSKFTTDMGFVKSSDLPAIPTYRVIDSDGVIADANRGPLEVEDAEVISWYKNMLSVSIMDLIMFDAQRQGRLSFYMVNSIPSFGLMRGRTLLTCM
jgi:2-oxoisovalerate dehydrogenase E1 component alpha subunit